MSIKIENKTFINGQDSKNISDDQIFDMIRGQEDAIKGLNQLDNKPQTLIDRVASMRKDVAALVAFVDQRTKDAK